MFYNLINTSGTTASGNIRSRLTKQAGNITNYAFVPNFFTLSPNILTKVYCLINLKNFQKNKLEPWKERIEVHVQKISVYRSPRYIVKKHIKTITKKITESIKSKEFSIAFQLANTFFVWIFSYNFNFLFDMPMLSRKQYIFNDIVL